MKDLLYYPRRSLEKLLNLSQKKTSIKDLIFGISPNGPNHKVCFYEYTFEECEHFLLQWSRRPSFAISWRHRNERSESKGPIFPYNVDWSLPIHTKGEFLLDNAPNYYLLGVLSKREVSCCFLFLLLIIIKSILHSHPSDCLFKK